MIYLAQARNPHPWRRISEGVDLVETQTRGQNGWDSIPAPPPTDCKTSRVEGDNTANSYDDQVV